MLVGSVDNDELAAAPDRSRRGFRFFLRNSEPDQGAREAAGGGAHTSACQSGDDRARSDDRSEAGNGQQPETREQATGAAEGSADTRAGCRSGFLVRSFANFPSLSFAASRNDAHVITLVTGVKEILEGLFSLSRIVIYTNH